ncbi:MAG: DUF2270 domain-containing protein [Thermoplasmata archaeon]
MKDLDPEGFVDKQSPSDFNNTLTHMYRAEVQRSYTWRNRLDNTSYWAIVLLSAIITWTFTEPENPHELVLFSLLFIIVLLNVEARRYMFYNVWNSRVRALEKDFVARMINPEISVTSRKWMNELAEDLQYPHFKIPYWHAISNRLRRIYVWLFSITTLLWYAKLAMHPQPASNFTEMVIRAKFFNIPGNVIFAVVTSFMIISILIAVTNPHYDERWDKIFTSKEAMENWRKNM